MERNKPPSFIWKQVFEGEVTLKVQLLGSGLRCVLVYGPKIATATMGQAVFNVPLTKRRMRNEVQLVTIFPE